MDSCKPTSGPSAYTKRSHTRHKALDFIQSCKLPDNEGTNTNASEPTGCGSSYKNGRRKRRKKCRKILEKKLIDNCLDKEDLENDPAAQMSDVNANETLPVGNSHKTLATHAGSLCNRAKQNANKVSESCGPSEEVMQKTSNLVFNGTNVDKTIGVEGPPGSHSSDKQNNMVFVRERVNRDEESGDISSFGNKYVNGSKRNNVIDIGPSFGRDSVCEKMSQNRTSNKKHKHNTCSTLDDNSGISCFSGSTNPVLKSYGDRFYEAKPCTIMSSVSSFDDGVNFVPSDIVVEREVTKQALTKTPQFWPGQKRKSKRGKSTNIFFNRKKSADEKVEKSNSEASWLDFVDSENNYEISANSENVLLDDKTWETERTNEQLNSYKKRFVNKYPLSEKPVLEDIDWNNQRKEAEIVKKFNRIGINVNDLNSSSAACTKRLDSTKRSRRKAEPFDFEKQSEVSVDILEKCKGKESFDLNSQHGASLDIPNSLCSFLTEELECKPLENSSRSLFSGSISDKGLYIPSSESTGHGGLFLKRNSFQKVFEKGYEYNSESGSDSDSLSDEDDMLDSTGDDTDDRGEGVLLPPEPQLGNVEYKLKLVNPTKQRFEHLVTQMKWRLREGRGEAVYGIGVRDCGRVRGLRSGRMKASLRTLRRMSDRLGAQCSLLAVVRTGSAGRYGAEVLVRKVPDDQHNIELRVAVMGANDAGKSTLVGVLSQGELDNGRGSARLNMFRHLHEVRTGRTSSVSHEILGFDSQGRPINYAYGDLTTPEEIVEKSSKLVSFIDLAGHRKYLKTTVQGLTGYSPHLAMLVISATGGINQMTLEHLALAVALQLPLLIVCTRADCGPVPEDAISELLKSANSRKVPHLIRNLEDCNVAAMSAWSLCSVPVLSVSSVTGQGLDLLRWFLYRLPPPPQYSLSPGDLHQESVEFQIDEVFRVGDRGGPVVAGLLKTGVITEKTTFLIGPLDCGGFAPAIVESMRRNRAACRTVRAGQAASLRLNCSVLHVRQGMVLLSVPENYPHSLDISEYREKHTCHFQISDTKLCKEKILSESNQLWSSEKVSPKATKKMKRRRRKLKTNNRTTMQEDSSTDDRDTLDEQEHYCDDCNQASSDSKGNWQHHYGTNIHYKQNVNFEKSTIDYDKGVVDRLKEKNLNTFGCEVDKDVGIEDIMNGSSHEGNHLTILRPSLDEDLKNLVKCFPLDDYQENSNEPRGCFFFQAQIKLLHNSSDIYPGFQSTVHIGSVRQTAVIEAIHTNDMRCVRAGNHAYVLFRFLRHPEYLRVTSPLLFREGLNTKGIGHITHIYHHHINNAKTCTTAEESLPCTP